MHDEEKFVGLYMSENDHTYTKEYCKDKGIKFQAFLTAAVKFVCDNDKYGEVVTAQVKPAGK